MTDDEKSHAKKMAAIEGLQLERGLIKPMKNPENPDDRFIIYFLPDEETVRKRSRGGEEIFLNKDDYVGDQIAEFR